MADFIQIIAGDFKSGKYLFDDTSTSIQYQNSRIFLTNTFVKSVERLTDESKTKRIGGSTGWGLAGLIALGPLGALAGLVLGGNVKELIFTCELKDGKKFLAKTSSGVFEKILAANFFTNQELGQTAPAIAPAEEPKAITKKAIPAPAPPNEFTLSGLAILAEVGGILPPQPADKVSEARQVDLTSEKYHNAMEKWDALLQFERIDITAYSWGMLHLITALVKLSDDAEAIEKLQEKLTPFELHEFHDLERKDAYDAMRVEVLLYIYHQKRLKHDYDQAFQYLKRAGRYIKHEEYEKSMAETYYLLGQEQFEKQHFKIARKYANQALNYNKANRGARILREQTAEVLQPTPVNKIKFFFLDLIATGDKIPLISLELFLMMFIGLELLQCFCLLMQDSVHLLIYLFLITLLMTGLLSGYLANLKGGNFYSWLAYGFFLAFVALPHAFFFKQPKGIPEIERTVIKKQQLLLKLLYSFTYIQLLCLVISLYIAYLAP